MKRYRKTSIISFAVLAALVIPGRLPAQQHHHYKLIDIGTFGGPASFFNATFNSVPALSNRGLAVGDSATSTPTPPNGGCLFCGGCRSRPVRLPCVRIAEGCRDRPRGASPCGLELKYRPGGQYEGRHHCWRFGKRCYRPAEPLRH